MNTEDDTFERLKRIPYLQIKELYSDFIFRTSATGNNFDTQLHSLMNENGWILKEFDELHFLEVENHLSNIRQKLNE